MALTYGFFNSVDGDRKYNASQMAEIFNGIINDGIFMSIGDAMLVTQATGMYVNVGTGRAWFNSTWTYLDSDLLLLVDAAPVVGSRIDLVILEVDTTDNVRANSIKILKGVPGSPGVAPALTDTEFVHQYALAELLIGAGVTTIPTDKITVLVGEAPTPFITGILETIDTSALIAEWGAEQDIWQASADQLLVDIQDDFDAAMLAWDNEFDVWFATIQDILDANVAGNLLAMIEDLDDTKAEQTEITRLQGQRLDLQLYKGTCVKVIHDGQTDWIDKWWPNTDSGTSALDTTNIWTGLSGVKITASAQWDGAHFLFPSNFNLADDGKSAFTTNDYIVFEYLVTAADLDNVGAEAINVFFYTSAFGDTSKCAGASIMKAAITADKKMLFAVKMSAFTITGALDWTDIKGGSIIINRSAGTPSVTVGRIHIVRCDPSAAKPNPCQRYINGAWTADFTPEAGCSLFVGTDKGDLTLKEITNSNGTSRMASILSSRSYIDFTISIKYRINSNTPYYGYYGWMIDINNGIYIYANGVWCSMRERHNGSSIQTLDLAIPQTNVNDIIHLILTKIGNSCWLQYYVNDFYVGTLPMTLQQVGDGLHAGYIALGSQGSNTGNNPSILEAEITTVDIVKKGYRASTTISSPTAAVSIAVPQQYKRIRLYLDNITSSNDTAAWASLNIQFNGDTGNNYNTRVTDGNSWEASNGIGYIKLTKYFSYNLGGNYKTSMVIDILNPTTSYKSIFGNVMNHVQETGNGPAQGTWLNNTSKIHTITIYGSVGNITGGTFEIVGVEE